MCTWPVYFTPVLWDCLRATSHFSSFHKSKKNPCLPFDKEKQIKQTDRQTTTATTTTTTIYQQQQQRWVY